MITDLNHAETEMLSLFWFAWAAAAAYNGGEIPRVDWDGVSDPPFERPEAEPWAAVTIRHGSGRQSTFGAPGGRRFENVGQLTVQVFAPMTVSKDRRLANNLAQIVIDAYRGESTSSGIWFRRVQAREIGKDPAGGPWYQVNVMVTFEYDNLA